MVLILDPTRRRYRRGNVASTRRFRRSGPRNCCDFFPPSYCYFVIHGPRPTLHRGVFSIPCFRFPRFSPERPGSVPLTIPAYRVGSRLGCYKLAHDSVLANWARHERSCCHKSEVESVSRQTATATISSTKILITALCFLIGSVLGLAVPVQLRHDSARSGCF